MNARERFIATMEFEPLNRPLYWEFGYWAPTLRRWYTEGLPKIAGIPDSLGDDSVVMGECLGIDWRNPHYDVDVNTALGFDEHMRRVPINNYFCPVFESKVLEDHPEWYKVVDCDGQIVQVNKSNGSRIHLDSPVKTREDYEKIKEERLQPDLSARLPKNWPEIKEQLKRRTYPLEYGGVQGFFNTPRRLLGFERLMYAFCTDPDLVRGMIDDVADLLIAIYDPVISELGGECALISEDMCYKSGCFISPGMFREFMMPAYKKLISFYHDHGIKTILVDSDGDVMGLLPLLVECGVTGLYPFECTGANDIVEVRKQFPRFQILGGIDKKKVSLTRVDIDAELERKVPQVWRTGGYIPFIDHTVPPEVSWENFCYYRKRLAELTRQATTALTTEQEAWPLFERRF